MKGILFLVALGLCQVSTYVVDRHPVETHHHLHGLSLPSHVDTRSLDDLLNQFFEFVPFDQIVEVVKRYMENDPDVKAAWEFLQSEEFNKLIDTVRNMPEYKDFVQYLMDAGFDLYKYINLLRAAFGLPPIVPPKIRSVKESGIIVMVKEILSLLPVEDIKNWYHTVCEPDPDYQAFLAKIRSPEFLVIVEKVYNSPQYQELTDIMRAQGIDVAAIEEAIRNFFNGAKRADPPSLDDLFNQFLEFIPFDQIVEVVKRYMANDPDVKQAWEFLQSDEFHKIIDTVRAMPEYKEFVKFLLDAGYDLYKYLNLLRAAFGLPPIVPPKIRMARESGIIVMVKEILTLLPVEDIKNWYHTVCEPDPVFQDFLAKLRSPEFLNIVMAVYNSPQYQELTAIMVAQGIDVAAIEEVIRNFFNGA
ncbi:hypothetical protein J437_LFUL015770 [Ladona fulva]|uniref:Protein G12 n=1 Tax=Ladona fulva TaxID=123851 RepID=A0A8K0PAI6_LADFU|nr:hypothetical protein J437_LFUL015770 [Ladona fulva]